MNEELTIYERLQQFVLFQGMSRNELLQLAGNTRFGFQKMQEGKTVVREGEACQQLYFMVSGEVAVTSMGSDHSYRMVEYFSAPWMFEPEALFGMSPRYRHTVSTHTDVHFITLTKDEVLRLLDDFLIFRLNLLNLMATVAQRHAQRRWLRSARTLEEQIIRFFVDHSVYPAGRKELYILMQQLANEVGTTRLRVSQQLGILQQQGHLQLFRGRIVIPALEHLLMK